MTEYCCYLLGLARELEVLAEEYDHDADRITHKIDRVRAALTHH